MMRDVGRNLPSGTVTFLFTDVEGSTKLLHSLGADGYADALATHRRVIREAFTAHDGVEVDTQGDAFFAAFPTAPGALAAALEATAALRDGPIRVRIGLHTGTPLLTDEGYVGADVHKGARIAAAGHGGQVLVSAATASLLDNASLKDLGEHRLKDLTAPERIFQADPHEHPPLQTLHQTNLPVPATPFVGRQAELSDLSTLLARGDVRLVTLTGPGGTGKTRLALQAAADAADAYADGVWWVPLAALRDPALVVPSVGEVLGASGELAEHIGDKRLLLLLDNFEHLTAAAGELAPLLATCPNLTLLVTSREPLHLAGEHEYSVDPLASEDAVELFLTRALAAKRDFVANGEVALICERLDHLPLAIELAAARVKVLSPKALLARLDQRLPLLAGGARDLPARQRTLRATIEWSHELLTPDEQRLFARMAVFRGGCTLEAAELVVDADLDTLGSLVDKSLVRVRANGRFWMLETIREFAAEQFAASDEADVLRSRHADYFLAVVDEAEPAVMGDDLPTLDRLGMDHDNLRSALEYLLEARDRDRFVRLAGSLWRFWYLRSHLLEGRRHLEAALEMGDEPSRHLAKVRRGLTVMTLNLGDIDVARSHAEASLALDRALGDEWGTAYATMMLAHCCSEARDERRDLPASRELNLEAASIFERLGDRHFALIARHNSTWILGELGDREAEQRGHEENLIIAREIGNESIEADCLAQLGMLASDQGRLDDAASLLRDALRVDSRVGMPLTMAAQLDRLSSVLVRQGNLEMGARLAGASSAAEQRLGSKEPWWTVERRQQTMQLIREGLGAERTDELVGAGARLTLEEAVALALGEF